MVYSNFQNNCTSGPQPILKAVTWCADPDFRKGGGDLQRQDGDQPIQGLQFLTAYTLNCTVVKNMALNFLSNIGWGSDTLPSFFWICDEIVYVINLFVHEKILW